MQTNTIISITVAALVLCSSCQKLDVAPSYQQTDLTFWQRPDAATNVLNTCYAGMYPDEYFFFNEDLSDNAFCVSPVNGSSVRSLAEGNYDARNARISGEWAYHYGGVRNCNNLLENIGKVPGLAETLRSRMMAEARFIRAFHYFQLYTWYGAVPLVTNQISLADSYTIGRTPRDSVRDFVFRELDFAAAHLPGKQEYAASDKGRITSGAAIALKARAELYEGNWQNVVTDCEKLMHSNSYGSYSLFPDYAGLFRAANENNSEVILDLEYVPMTRTHADQRFFIPRTEGQLIDGIAPSQELVNDYIMTNGKPITDPASGYNENDPYTNRDPRFNATIIHNGSLFTAKNGSTFTVYTLPGTGDNSVDNADATPTGYYVSKYYDQTADAANNSGLNLILIRYADILLMYAEAKNELGQMDQPTWDASIGALRQRAGFTMAAALNFDPSLTKDQLRNTIRRERRSELAMEGLRIFDLRRWKTAETMLNGWLTGFRVGGSYLQVDKRFFDSRKHYLWPVPQTDLNLNHNLTQNPNW
jgi:hypothetical protein